MPDRHERKKYWEAFPSWEEATEIWSQTESLAKESKPLKELQHLPRLPAMKRGMTEKEVHFFRAKSLLYLLRHDSGFSLLRKLLKKPFSYFFAYLLSLFRGVSYLRAGDFFLYGIEQEKNLVELYQKHPKASFLLGFSYCHKPFECPDGRFTDVCRADLQNSVCQQCFIGKMVHFSPSKSQLLFIPTIHYIAKKVLEAKSKNPNEPILFLITACEMTLEMFGDWGNAVGLQGIGVRLDGRICTTRKAFDLSERGIKPGLTCVTRPTQERMLLLMRSLARA